MPPVPATVAVTDLRDFTTIFDEFAARGDGAFAAFMAEFYSTGHRLAQLAAGGAEVHIHNTGDGLLTIFFGERHAHAGYLYGLLLDRLLGERAATFRAAHGQELNFGIGIEEGEVERVVAADGAIETWLGSVINVAARIENRTKSFHRTRLLVGNRLYRTLVRTLFPAEYGSVVLASEEKLRDFSAIMAHHNDLNLLSQRLMLFYLFEHRLKGVMQPLALFRLSPTLAGNGERFRAVVALLCGSPARTAEALALLDAASA